MQQPGIGSPEFVYRTTVPGGTVDVTGNGRIIYRMREDSAPTGVPVYGIFEEQVDSSPSCRLREIDSAALDLREFRHGMDLILKAHSGSIEKIFVVHPGGNPTDIRVAVNGARDIAVVPDGSLEVDTGSMIAVFSAPVAYQEMNGERIPVQAAYTIGGNQYGFSVGEYDSTRDLVIDPMLASTYLGDTGNDYIYGMATDGSGNVYVCGKTSSADFPVSTNAYGTNIVGMTDVFVCKFDPDVTNLLAATFVGGDKDDIAYAIVIDDETNVYVSGETKSTNFPAVNAYDDKYSDTNNHADGFVCKLNSSLTNLLASTFLGGVERDYCHDLALDSHTNVYVCGGTGSTNYPTKATPYDDSYAGHQDCFVSKLSDDLSQLLASTFLGGTSNDYNPVIHMATNDDVYVCGTTASTNFPVRNGYSITNAGTRDCFVTLLERDLTNVIGSTYLGGGNWDEGLAIDIDSNDYVYICGRSSSTNFPTSQTAYKTNAVSGAWSGFVSKLDTNLANLAASTLLADNEVQTHFATALYVSSTDSVYVAGQTTSTTFPTTPGAYDRSFNSVSPGLMRDVYLARLDTGLTSLERSTFLGGNSWEDAYSVIIGPTGTVYVAGETLSTNFPSVSAYAPTNSGGYDAFLLRLDPELLHWWYGYGVIDTNAVLTNDFAAANLGHIKWIASRARQAMEDKLQGGAGTTVNSLVDGFKITNNFHVANLGQLKNVAKPFYDRLGLAYPWLNMAQTNDYGVANIGQVKNTFSFIISN